MTNKTHVLYLSTTGRQYHKFQLVLRFCAILGVEMSVGSSGTTGTSAGSSAGTSVGPRNMVRFTL
jgi:hypothetical protein